MTVRFFMLQTHYRSTLDFSNEALEASEKGFSRLMDGWQTLNNLKADAKSTEDIKTLTENCNNAMSDDFNSPVLIAHLFDAVRIINSVNDGKASLTESDLAALKKLYSEFVFDVLGLKAANTSGADNDALARLMEYMLEIRSRAKTERNFKLSDEIREKLTKAGIQVNDTKEGSTWKLA